MKNLRNRKTKAPVVSYVDANRQILDVDEVESFSAEDVKAEKNTQAIDDEKYLGVSRYWVSPSGYTLDVHNFKKWKTEDQVNFFMTFESITSDLIQVIGAPFLGRITENIHLIDFYEKILFRYRSDFMILEISLGKYVILESESFKDVLNLEKKVYSSEKTLYGNIAMHVYHAINSFKSQEEDAPESFFIACLLDENFNNEIFRLSPVSYTPATSTIIVEIQDATLTQCSYVPYFASNVMQAGLWHVNIDDRYDRDDVNAKINGHETSLTFHKITTSI